MTVIVPNVGKVAILNEILNRGLVLKLFGNNRTPDITDTSASYNEISGGGYASVNLVFANWVISSAGIALYPSQNFRFTGPVNSPGSVYGYYLVDNNDVLRWVERFPTTVLQLVPVKDTLIRVTPRIQAK